MLYGSMLGLLGAAVLGSLAASYFGLSSFQDLRPTSDPNGHALQRWLEPYKERIQVRLPAACMHSGMVVYSICLSELLSALLGNGVMGNAVWACFMPLMLELSSW